jgi:hypothetical protein
MNGAAGDRQTKPDRVSNDVCATERRDDDAARCDKGVAAIVGEQRRMLIDDPSREIDPGIPVRARA